MIEGRVVQVDEPETVYSSPATVEIARLFGDPTINLLPVEPTRDGARLTATIANTRVHLGQGFDVAQGQGCILGLRPEDLLIEEEPSADAVPVDVMASHP